MTEELKDDWIGRRVLGRYRVIRPLARGGMGAVYLARIEGAAGFSKPAVIKRVLPHLSDAADSKAQFVREARILSNLQHPGIVGVIDFAEEKGAYLMVLDYVHGYHVGQWLKYLRSKRQNMPWEFAVLIMIRVLAALHYAHTFRRSDGSRAEIIHRDISPGNILLDLDGNVRLLDFGIARMEEEASNQYQTKDGTFKGKLPYVAPEIYGNEKAGPRTDVYSCGVVLYQLLTGENPFIAKSTSETVRRVLTLVPAPINATRDDVPPEIDPIIEKALAKEGNARYQTAEEFSNALRRLFVSGEAAVFAEMASAIRADFTADMPQKLDVFSLEELEASWREAQEGPEEQRVLLTSSAPPERTEVMDGREVALPADPQTPKETMALGETKPAPRPGLTGRQLLLGGAVAVLLAGVAAVLAVVLTRENSKPTQPHYLVVESPDNQPKETPPAKSTAPEPVDAESPPAQPSDTTPAPSATGAPEATSKASSKATRASGDSAAELTRTFARQQTRIQGCFSSNAQDVSGSPRISVRIGIDASGTVQTASVQPAALGGTALGQCIAGVARSTQFPAQAGPVVFTIPITAHVK